MNGFEIFLPFSVYAEHLKLLSEATAKQEWTAWLAFVQKHRIVVKWECKDRDGNLLDPSKKEDWEKISVSAIAQLIRAVNLHVGGASEAGNA